MAKTCKNCKIKFDHKPVKEPYQASFCSYTCKYEYYADGKESEELKRVSKFIWFIFKKQNGRIEKLISGRYSISDLYLSYLYFCINKFPTDYSKYLIDEYEFPFVFIEIFEKKKHIKLTTILKTSTNNFSEYCLDFPYYSQKDKYFPFGENLYYVSEENDLFNLYHDCGIDEEICESLADKKESELEKLLVKTVEEKRGICWKLAASSPGCAGAPDRLVIMPNNKFGFIEVKRPNGTGIISNVQEKQLKRLSKFTNNVYVLDNPQNIISILQDIEFNKYPELRYSTKKS